MATSTSTPPKLHTAVCNPHDDVTAVKSLLASGECQINKQDDEGVTAFMTAAKYGNINIMKYLLDNNVDVCSSDFSGKNALHYAIEYGSIGAVVLLLEQHRRVPDLIRQRLIDAKTDSRVTPLIKASEINFITACRLLVESKAELNATTDRGYTALHVAAEKKCANIVALLIKHGASLDIPTTEGSTPLALATKENHIYIAGLLVNAKADVNQPNNNGDAPAHMAAKYGHLEIMTCLVKQGHCDLTTVNKAQQTPLEVSELHNRPAVQELLKLTLSSSIGKARSSKVLKDRMDLKYSTMRHLQKASTCSISTTIHDSYSKLLAIRYTLRTKRAIQRKPLRSISQWESYLPDKLEADGIQSTKSMLQGKKHGKGSSPRRKTIGEVEQSLPTSDYDKDGSSGDSAGCEEDTPFLQQTRTLEKKVKHAETELKKLTAEKEMSLPRCDCSSDSSWLDIFRHPIHQQLQTLIDKMNELHMIIELFYSMVHTLDNRQTCGLHDESHIDHGELSDKALYKVANQLGKDWMWLGIELGMTHNTMECLQHNNTRDIEAATRNMLIRWRNSCTLPTSEKKAKLVEALQSIKRHDVAESLES